METSVLDNDAKYVSNKLHCFISHMTVNVLECIIHCEVLPNIKEQLNISCAKWSSKNGS